MKDPKLTNSGGNTTTLPRPSGAPPKERVNESLNDYSIIRRNDPGDFGVSKGYSPGRVKKSTIPHNPNPSKGGKTD